ncbi:MAG TPA: polysaccharide biosynthesis tyrosine autokinase [Candidatus Acidoferrales bacterium]|nr:polysaccharide biosynthesis tyrosine autokinase [Candidatus Acidoferrales bacterium]
MDDDNKIQRYEPVPRSLERHRPAALALSEPVEMQEAPDLLFYWRIIRKRRWTILTIFFVIFTLVVLWTLKQAPVYRATALIEIQKENADIPSFQELFELESVSDTYLETQYKILESTSLARRVIDQLGLDKLKEFNPPKGWLSSRKNKKTAAPETQTFTAGGPTGAASDVEAYQELLEGFAARLQVEPVRRSRLVEVSFNSEDPILAARVVNTLASNYVEQNLEARWEATQKASEWLSQQLLGLKGRLEKSEEELQNYVRAQGLLFLETETGTRENIVNERLRKLQEELTRAQADRYQKESLYRLIEGGDYGSLPGVVENRLMQDLTVSLAQLKREYADLSTTFTPEYYRVKQVQNQINEIEEVLARERERAAKQITNDYRAAVQREALLRQAFGNQEEQANLIAEKSVQYNILRREVDTNKQLYEGLLGRLKLAGVSAGLKASNIRIVDPAAPPDWPAKPRVLLNLALAVVLGLGMGVGAAFLQEHLDNTLKRSEDVERFLHVPALALIPSIESLNGRRGGIYGIYGRSKMLAGGVRASSKPTALVPKAQVPRWYRIDTQGEQHMALSEAFRTLRTSVLLSTADRPPRALLVTSSQPGEGKTTISANLAISLAQLGRRVLLIDGDMRRPCIHRAFQVKEGAGLVSYLTGQRAWQEAVQTTRVPGLDVLVCGPIPPNPAELLSSDRMRLLIREVVGEYDFVVLDSPPLLNVADSRVLATLVEGVVLVVKGGATPRELVQRAQSNIRDVGAHVIGVVLNNLDVRADDYYYYRYHSYGYYSSWDEHTEKEHS